MMSSFPKYSYMETEFVFVFLMDLKVKISRSMWTQMSGHVRAAFFFMTLAFVSLPNKDVPDGEVTFTPDALWLKFRDHQSRTVSQIFILCRCDSTCHTPTQQRLLKPDSAEHALTPHVCYSPR